MTRKSPPDSGFAHRFRLLCDRQGLPWAQQEIGKFIGKSGTTAWNYMNGVKLPSMDSAIDLARRFKCPVEWLLTGRGSPDLPPDSPVAADIRQAVEMLQVMEGGARYRAVQMIRILAETAPGDPEHGQPPSAPPHRRFSDK